MFDFDIPVTIRLEIGAFLTEEKLLRILISNLLRKLNFEACFQPDACHGKSISAEARTTNTSKIMFANRLPGSDPPAMWCGSWGRESIGYPL